MFKRLFDVTVSFTCLMLLWPLLLVLGLAVKINSPGPIFYRALRVGQYKKLFYVYKFRSMVANADKIGPAVTGAQDMRITTVGRFLRHTKLDELPQLYNVIKGEMSLVGPRPESPHYVQIYTQQQQQILNVRPGITSPASIHYRHEAEMLVGENWEQDYIEKVMPAKLAIDIEYAQDPSILKDIRIIFGTFTALFR